MQKHFLTILKFLNNYNGDMEYYRIDNLLSLEDEKKILILFEMINRELINLDYQKSDLGTSYVGEVYAMISPEGEDYLKKSKVL